MDFADFELAVVTKVLNIVQNIFYIYIVYQINYRNINMKILWAVSLFDVCILGKALEIRNLNLRKHTKGFDFKLIVKSTIQAYLFKLRSRSRRNCMLRRSRVAPFMYPQYNEIRLYLFFHDSISHFICIQYL